uniref:DNA damage-induced apoptosis suppressor protein n=1 Tax=Nannospalax galili TaxID=1026970 RepID=A0A8C6RMV8_NANGA
MSKRRKFLLASVLALQNSSFIYPSCQKCFSRVVFVSERSTCPKCGSTGEAEKASYRYRLSLKVAESSKLLIITVFGSCLDIFFGLTATDLHRYLQDSTKIPETLDSGTTQSLLTEAVENCFVGQSFVFGVTNFGNICGHDSDSNNFLQQCCGHRGEVRALVASQIILPDPRIAGFTVIDYFHQLLKHHCSSQELSGHSLTLDFSNNDLSSIHGSGNSSYFLESHGRDKFLRFWQPSLELTSTDSQLGDNNEFSASEQSMASDTPHQNRQCISFAEGTGPKSCHDPIQGSWSLVSHMDKENTAEKLDEEFVLQANHLSVVCSSHHETRLSNSSLLPLQMQEPFEEDNTESCSTAEIKNSYSQCELPCYQHHDVDTTTILQERATCSPLSRRPEETARVSQDCDSLIWDDLPLSESLNKFLAVVESEISITKTDVKNRKHCNDIDKFHTDHSRLSVTPWRITGTLTTPPMALKSSQAMIKENSSKENFFFNCESNTSFWIQKESKPDNKVETVSTRSSKSGISEYFLPNTYLSTLFISSEDMETSFKKTMNIVPHKNEISFRASSSASDYSYLSNKYLHGHRGKSLSQMKEKSTTLPSKKYNDVSDLWKLENKPKTQDDSFTICRKLTYPLETLCSSPRRSTNTLKDITYRCSNNNLTQNYSAGHEGSFDVSADLFDDIDKDEDIGTEITKKSQDILLPWESSWAEKHPITENCSQPSQKLLLQSTSTSEYPRISSQPDSECDLEESQGFVPCSQSTPIAGFHRRTTQELSGALKKLPSFSSNLDANYKKPKLSPESSKQVTPTCTNVKTPSQKSRIPFIPSITQPEISNHCPAAECLESDMNEWVPPTTQKVFFSDMLGFRVMCLSVHHSPDQKELPRKRLIQVRHKAD